MKRYNSVFEFAAELDAQGFVKDRGITIPADSDPEEGCLRCNDGELHSFPKYKAYYIILCEIETFILIDPNEDCGKDDGILDRVQMTSIEAEARNYQNRKTNSDRRWIKER